MQRGVLKWVLHLDAPAPPIGRRLYDRLRGPAAQPHRNHALPSPASLQAFLARLRARGLARFGTIALVAISTGLLAACGSSNAGGTSADPASVVPASAVLYAGATVRPTGALEKQALAAGHALTHQANPFLRLLAALQTPGSATLSFSHDVAPWLGPHAGIFLTSLHSSGALPSLLEQSLLGSGTAAAFPFASGGAEGAIVLDTSNIENARSFVDAQAKRAGAQPSRYRGVAYQVNSGGVAFGLVDRFVVIGSQAGLHAVIDTAAGASALAHAGGYSKLLAVAPPEALGHLYSKAAGAKRPGGQEGLSEALLVLAGTNEANVSVVPSQKSLALDADTLAPESSPPSGGLLSVDPEGPKALGELPGESWLAIGLGHVGTTLGRDAQDIAGLVALSSATASAGPSAGASSFGLGSLLGGLVAPLEVLGSPTPQAKREFASWMGSAGIFASGASLFELRAAVAISSNDPARSRAAVGELAAQLHKTDRAAITSVTIAGTNAAVGVRLTGLPLVLDIANGTAANGQTKFVLGLGEASVSSALNPPNTLAGEPSPTAAAAAASLGEGIRPNLIVSVPTLLSLFETVGLLEQPPISHFLTYLRALTTIAGGGYQLNAEVQRYRLVIGLQ
jgi:Protein of unknown function (DUF3352)